MTSECIISIGGDDNYIVDEYDTTASDRCLAISNSHDDGIICIKLGGSSTSSKFQVKDSAGADLFSVHAGGTSTGSSYKLNNLTDVDTTGIATNKILKYNGSDWAMADEAGGSTNYPDSVAVTFGDDDDLSIQHNSTNSVISNDTGDLIIENTAGDKRIIMKLGTTTDATWFDIKDSNDAFLFTAFADGTVQINGPQINKFQPAASLVTDNPNTNQIYDTIQFMNGLIIRDCNGASRTDTIPSGANIINAIKWPAVGTTFEVLICNISGTGEDITLADNGSSTVIGINVIPSGQNMKFTGIVRNVTNILERYDLFSHGSSTSDTDYITSISTFPLPAKKEEVTFIGEKPIYAYLDTSGRRIKFNKGKIFITEAGSNTCTFYLAIYKLTVSATFNDLSTYNNSTRTVMSSSVSWSNSSGTTGNGEGFCYFDFSTTTLDATGDYFIGLFNSTSSHKYLSWKDAGDPNKGLDGLYYIGNSSEPVPTNNMLNTNDASKKGDPAYIRLYYE